MTCRNEKCLSLLHRTLVALFHLVTKEHLVLIRGTAPTLKESQISICGADQVEDLLTLKKKKDTISKMSNKVLLGGRDVPKGQISLPSFTTIAVCQTHFPLFISFFIHCWNFLQTYENNLKEVFKSKLFKLELYTKHLLLFQMQYQMKNSLYR